MINFESLLKFFNFDEPSSISGTKDIVLVPGRETTLASVTLNNIKCNDRILLMATVGWKALTVEPELEFKIHQDSVTTPPIFSTIDAGFTLFINDLTEFTQKRFTTSFNHAQTHVQGRHTYILTVTLKLKNDPDPTIPQGTASIIGPINFDGFVIDENKK